jgi:hypothetical protein
MGGQELSGEVEREMGVPLLNKIPIQNRLTANRGSVRDASGSMVDTWEVARKLQDNSGQKVVVGSVNVNSATADVLRQLGAKFTKGANDTSWAVIDEAQFRSLTELAGGGQAVFSDERRQEAIVGTDALLANGMLANSTFARDRDNTLTVNGNPVRLAHENYLVIDNGTSLTAIKAGPMQFWTEKPADVGFVQAPQVIEVPRVGQLVRFEKSIVDPTDRMVLRAEYSWNVKGASK